MFPVLADAVQNDRLDIIYYVRFSHPGLEN
jgi:hypothetical protein